MSPSKRLPVRLSWRGAPENDRKVRFSFQLLEPLTRLSQQILGSICDGGKVHD